MQHNLFRFPKAIVNPNWFQPYDLPDAITITQTSKYIVLDIEINEEEGMQGWVEGEGWLPQLLPLRDELLGGDLRLLYLVWLRVAPYLAGNALDDDPVEPPISPNLSQLSQPLKAFIELVELNPDWIAEKGSGKSSSSSPLRFTVGKLAVCSFGTRTARIFGLNLYGANLMLTCN